MRLHSDWPYLEQEFGCSLRHSFLMAVRSFDNAKAVTPLLAEAGGRRFGLFMHVEKGNVEAANLPPDIEPVFYNPYFTFDGSDADGVHATLADAIAFVGGNASITVDQHLPVALWRQLSGRFDVTSAPSESLGPVCVRRGSRAGLIGLLSQRRAASRPAALALLDRSPHRQAVQEFLDNPDDGRFADLDRDLQSAGLDAVLVTSALNCQEIGGVPMHAKDRPLAVLYRPGADPWIMERCQSSGARTYGSPADALRDLCPAGRLGIEEDDVAIGTWRGFALDGRDTAAAGGLIRRWRDNNTRPDIAFYVIAGRASVAATERALEFAGDAVRRGRAIVETDIFAVYLDCLRDFIRKVAPELRLGRTLTNFHGGGRTVFPSNAAPRPVTKETGTFKIDAGCLLLDADGMLLGCSDIARTLCFTDDAQDLYLKFADAIRMTVVPACKAGAAGNDVHALAVEAIWNPARGPSGNPLVPELENPQAAYDRDVGHLLGRNNLAHLRLARGDATPLRAGMIACCEYQWPIANMAIAYEDTCLVGGSGGFNLVSDIGTPPRIY